MNKRDIVGYQCNGCGKITQGEQYPLGCRFCGRWSIPGWIASGFSEEPFRSEVEPAPVQGYLFEEDE